MAPHLTESHRTTGKIVSLAMLIDGWVGHEERDALATSGLFERLGLDQESFEQIFTEFSTETRQFEGADFTVRPRIANDLVERLLDQVIDPVVQADLLEAIACVAYADGILTTEESQLLRMARERWAGATTLIN